MNLLLITLMLIIAVLVSNFLSKLLPAVATPLVQIALGVVLAFVLPGTNDFELPTTLFMALFVAPLIYSDSKDIDRVTAWRNRRTILKLAIGLVIVNTLVVGFLMGTVVWALPVAAAFVLGAALSPTDPVSVAALAESSNITKRQRAILQTESIVNDATGVVVFNIALAALLTGAFSLVEAGESFLWLFFGGIVCGLALGIAGNLVSSFARKLGCDDVVFHVLFDLAMPFITFLVGEGIEVSPIMAVMVCALVFQVSRGESGPRESRMNIVSSSAWTVLSFVLNGIVFVMLGFQLKASISDILLSGISAGELVGASALLVCLLIAIRFVWVTAMEFLTRHRLQRQASRYQRMPKEDQPVLPHATSAQVVRNSAVLTFAGGTKGAITLSIAFSIPYSIASRSLIVFLVSVAIIVSIVLANILIPILSPAPASTRDEQLERERRAKIDILRHVVGELSAESEEEDEMATQLVIADYNRRIETLKSGLREPEASRKAMRAHALELEAHRCGELMELHECSNEDGYAYLLRVSHLQNALDGSNRFRWLLARNMRRARGIVRSVVGLVRERVEEAFDLDERTVGLRELQRKCAEYVVEHLSDEVLDGTYPIEDVTQVMMEYQRTIERLDTVNPSLTTIAQRDKQKDEIALRGVNYELEGIQNAFDEGKITRESARKMRDDAYLIRLDLKNLV